MSTRREPAPLLWRRRKVSARASVCLETREGLSSKGFYFFFITRRLSHVTSCVTWPFSKKSAMQGISLLRDTNDPSPKPATGVCVFDRLACARKPLAGKIHNSSASFSSTNAKLQIRTRSSLLKVGTPLTFPIISSTSVLVTREQGSTNGSSAA